MNPEASPLTLKVPPFGSSSSVLQDAPSVTASLTRLILFDFSTPGLPWVPATRIEVAKLQPIVPYQQPELSRKRHRLPHVGEKGRHAHRLVPQTCLYSLRGYGSRLALATAS